MEDYESKAPATPYRHECAECRGEYWSASPTDWLCSIDCEDAYLVRDRRFQMGHRP